MGGLGAWEIILIVLVVLLLFGGKKIPELMRGLGRGMREFNDAKNNVKRELDETVSDNDTRSTTTKTTTTSSSTNLS